VKTNLISLTTDFGNRDGYVGQLKGVILKKNLSARIVDLSHEVPAQDILFAAVLISRSYQYFPAGTVHLIVVDPGVGSQRHILAAKADGHFFVAPDNGVLSFVFEKSLDADIHRVENTSLFANNISATFHGRDIMAPIVCELAGGLPINNIGPGITRQQSVFLNEIVVKKDKNRLTGQIIFIDRFGNIGTNISSTDLLDLPTDNRLHLECNGFIIKGLKNSYYQQEEGKLLALIDSSGYLELAVNMGNAARHINCQVGDRITINW